MGNYFNELKHNFPRFQEGGWEEGCPAFSRGWVPFAIPMETYRTCDFPGGWGVQTSCPHSGSAHVIAVADSKLKAKMSLHIYTDVN